MSSVLTSADLNIVRSSTRLHAPPGGVSSISFGSDVNEPIKPTRQQAPRVIQDIFDHAPVPVVNNRKNSVHDSSQMSAIFGGSEPVRNPRQGNASSAAMNAVFNHDGNAHQSEPAVARNGGRRGSDYGRSSMNIIG